jgi:hypothetical protein
LKCRQDAFEIVVDVVKENRDLNFSLEKLVRFDVTLFVSWSLVSSCEVAMVSYSILPQDFLAKMTISALLKISFFLVCKNRLGIHCCTFLKS